MSDSKTVISRLLADAGRRRLRPLGLLQRGRSRFWRDDRYWFAIGVEFEPSSWSKGSYLSVGCSWFWMLKAHFSYDVGGRVAPFTGFRTEEQFRPVADEIAAKAAEEVVRYRNMFPTAKSVCDYYLGEKCEGLWPNFNAAIACTLSGETAKAAYFFTSVAESPDDAGWARDAREDAAVLQTLSHNPEAFREAVPFLYLAQAVLGRFIHESPLELKQFRILADKGDTVLCFKELCDAYLVKPIDLGQLLTR